MRVSFFRVLFVSASLTLLSGCVRLNGQTASTRFLQNTLTAAEKGAGWRLLFDGRTTQGWRNFRKPTFPEHGWVIENGCLKCVAGGHGGDLVSVDEFDDFDLEWDWKLPVNANNGVKYFITESRTNAIGHEYQMIDDAGNEDGKLGAIHQTASFYDVLPARADKPLKPVGEWNHSRVLVRGNHVEHWLNGAKVLEYELGSPEVLAAVAKSKFKHVPGFGTKIRGRILLTEHHDEAWFRNIKLHAPVAP